MMRARLACAAAGVIAAIALGACSSSPEAEVVERSYEPASRRAGPPPRRTTQPDHVVVRGDTLHAIAFARGVSVRELAAWNGLAPPYTIYPGQRLKVGPGRADAAAFPRVSERYPVRPARPIADTSRPPPRAAPRGGASRVDDPPSAGRRPPPPRSELRTGSAEVHALGEDDASAPTLLPPPTASRPPRPLPAPAPRAAPEPQASSAAEPPPRGRPESVIPEPTAAETAPSRPTITAAITSGPSRAVGGVSWRWPAQGTVTAGFRAGDPARQGIDIRGRGGDAVVAAADGEVVYSGNGLLGYGELIIVKHAGEFLSAYAYNRKRLVAEGDRVRAGQPIAEMGRRGGALDLLHFEIRRGGTPVDPQQYLPPR